MDVISLSKAKKAKKAIKQTQDRLGMNGTESGERDVKDIYSNVKTRLEELEKKDPKIELYNRVSEVESNTAINLNKHNLYINSILNKNKYGLTDLAFDDFGDDSGIDHSKSTGHEFDAVGRKVKIASGQTQAEVVTTAEETTAVPRMITVSQAFNEKLTSESQIDLANGTHTNTEVVNGKIQLKIIDIYDPSINQLSNYNKVIYVDGVLGNDTTGDGSANAPYKTIKKAFDNAIHNTCIWIVKEGTYTINNGLQEILSTDKAITYDTPLKGKIIFDLKRSEYNINIQMNQLNRFIGIVFQYSGGASGNNGQRVYEYFFDGALINLQFDNCVFSNQGTPPTAAVIYTGNSSGCSVTKLQFNNCSFLTSFASKHTGSGVLKGSYVNCAFYDNDYTSDPYNLLNARFDANYQITTNGWQNTGLNGENIGVYGGQYNWSLRTVYVGQGTYESPVLDLGDNFKDIVKIDQIMDIPVGDFTNDVVPTMTSNTTPSPIVISASYEQKPAWKAFNDTNVDINDCWYSASGNSGWLQVDFGVGNAKNIQAYTVTSQTSYASYSPKSWELLGSNDGVNWTLLDKRENEINWSTNEKREYKFTNLSSYRYYRFNVLDNNGGAYVSIGELELKEQKGISAQLNIYTSTSSDNVTFSDWQPVNPDGTITSPSARYIKVKVELIGSGEVQEKLIYDFTSTESTNFQNNDNVIFDGSLKLKTQYTDTMTVDTSFTDTGTLLRKTINKNQFKSIESIKVP